MKFDSHHYMLVFLLLANIILHILLHNQTQELKDTAIDLGYGQYKYQDTKEGFEWVQPHD